MSRAEEAKPSKRNRPSKAGESSSNMLLSQQAMHTPQIMTQSLPHTSPSQASPQRSTPGSATKPPVVKALPTVRDHTTDQLGPEGDEYLPRETDPDGETKVSKDGYPLDNRKYKCRTFQVPNRGEKLFMLATECARVLGYRDSYLLFNKNRSLYKIIANQQEKDNLIHQEILPYSYRSRQIAIVTARSMFRQFGGRLIESGRRVRDDYWEAKARKQGFTEEDAAGEKRPGAAKAREAAAVEASNAANSLTSLPHGEVIYSNVPGMDGQPPGLQPVSLAPLPMIHLPNDDLRPGAFGNAMRPRQDATGTPYQDRIQPSNSNEILAQATQAAEFNKQLGQNRTHRQSYLDDYWRQPHEQPSTQAEQGSADMGTVAPQQLQSPQTAIGMSQSRGQHDQLSHPGSQMVTQGYASYPSQQNMSASPVQSMHRQMAPSQLHQTSPSMSISGARQGSSYGYGSNQMWQGAPQPQPSPLAQAHHLQQYTQTPQLYNTPMAPPQMPPQTNMSYNQAGQLSGGAYAGMNRNMYQPSPSPQHFGVAPQSHPGQQPNMQGWSTPSSMPQDWQRYQ